MKDLRYITLHKQSEKRQIRIMYVFVNDKRLKSFLEKLKTKFPEHDLIEIEKINE